MASATASSKPKLSSKERELFALLPKNGESIDTNALVKRFYRGKDLPFNARAIIYGRMRSIMKKLERKRDAPRIVQSIRRGPHPVEYRLVEK